MRRLFLSLVVICSCVSPQETVSRVNADKFSVAKHRRFLLYDVNHGEGFNLRRDVHLRMANAVRLLREQGWLSVRWKLQGENVVLVLPPFGGLFHWQKQEVRVPWSAFFDVASLNLFVPSIEFEDFLQGAPQ